MSNVKYPDVEVQLSGRDGNVFAIIGAVSKELRRNGAPAGEFRTAATNCGSYDELLNLVQQWVTVY